MERVPDVLSLELPPAELHALRLDGELFPLGEVFLALDALDDPATRARAAFAGRSARLIAELGTAAWIWGAGEAPPERFEFCAPLEERARLGPGARDAVREVVIDETERRLVAGRRVTHPARTALDLARFREDADYDAGVVARLLGPEGAGPVLAVLERRRHLKHAERARARLSAVDAGLSRR